MRNWVSDYYLHHNITTSLGQVNRPKFRIIVVVKRDEWVLISAPVKLSNFVSWYGTGDNAFDNIKQARVFLNNSKGNPDALDPRVVFPGHTYNLLRSHDYQVQREEIDKNIIYKYPFDLINPAERNSVKGGLDYMYTNKKPYMITSTEMKNKISSVQREELYKYVGIIGNGEDKVKRLYSYTMTPDTFKKAYSILKLKPSRDWKAELITKVVNFPVFASYEWYDSLPLATTYKEMIYDPRNS